MSTIRSEPPTSGNATEARPQPEETGARIDGILHNFDVLSSKAEKHIFQYAYLYFFGLFLSFIAFVIAGGVLLGYTKNNSNFVSLTGGTNFITYVIRGSGNSLLFVVWISLVLWMFNAWQEHVPHFLRDVFERRRIDVPAGDVNTHYLAFLKRYRDALRSPRRYLLIGSLLAIEAIYTSNGEKVRFV